MHQETKKSTNGTGIFLLFVAFITFWIFPVGPVLSLFMLLLAFFFGINKEGSWVCEQCNYMVSRKA